MSKQLIVVLIVFSFTLVLTLPVAAQDGPSALNATTVNQIVRLAAFGQGSSHDLAWSPDGRSIAVASDSGLQLHDAATLQHRGRLGDRPWPVTAAFWTRDSATVLTANTTEVVHWEVATDLELDWIPILDGYDVAGGEMALDGSRVVLLDESYRNLVVWQMVPQPHLIMIEMIQTHGIESVAMSPDGRYAVAGTREGNVEVWDVETRQRHFTLEGAHGNPVTALAWAGHTLVSAGEAQIKLWDVRTQTETMRLEDHTACVHDLAFAPNGGRLASASYDRSVRVWDLNGGQTLALYEGREMMSDLSWSPDGRELAALAEGGDVYVISPHSGELLRRTDSYKGAFSDASWSPDGSRLAVASLDAATYIWDVANDTTRVLPWASAVVAWSPDGDKLALQGPDGKIAVVGVNHLDVLHTIDHAAAPVALTWAPDSQQLAFGDRDGTVVVWDLNVNRAIHEWQDLTLDGPNLQWSADGRHVAALNRGNEILWDMQTALPSVHLQDGNYALEALDFSPDGTQFVDVHLPDRLDFHQTAGGQIVRSAAIGVHNVRTISWSPTGDFLAMTSDEEKVILWDVNGNYRARVIEGAWFASAVVWAPDGNRFAVVGSAGTVEVWGIDVHACTVASAGAVNLRAEATTASTALGTTQPGVNLRAVGQTTDAQGFVWWQLESGAWVRSDVVSASGPCGDLPTVE